jgi:hypothetical protein
MFCSSVGLRLVRNSPNQYGSFLPPTGWFVLGFVFLSGGLMVAFSKQPDILGSGFSFFFSYLCFRQGKAYQASGRDNANL